MELNQKCALFWETIHINLFSSGRGLSEVNIDLLCDQTNACTEIARERLFSSNGDLSCEELLKTMWEGIRRSCMELCPGCENVLPHSSEVLTFAEITDFYGWINIGILIEDFYMYVCMISINNIITRNLGFAVDHDIEGSTILVYNQTPTGGIDRYKLLFLICQVNDEGATNGLSNFCCEVVHTVVQLTLLGSIRSFRVVGPTLMTSFTAASTHIASMFMRSSISCTKIQRAWRTKKRNELILTLGFVVLRRFGTFGNMLDACYGYLVYPQNRDFTFGYDIETAL